MFTIDFTVDLITWSGMTAVLIVFGIMVVYWIFKFIASIVVGG